VLTNVLANASRGHENRHRRRGNGSKAQGGSPCPVILTRLTGKRYCIRKAWRQRESGSSTNHVDPDPSSGRASKARQGRGMRSKPAELRSAGEVGHLPLRTV